MNGERCVDFHPLVTSRNRTEKDRSRDFPQRRGLMRNCGGEVSKEIIMDFQIGELLLIHEQSEMIKNRAVLRRPQHKLSEASLRIVSRMRFSVTKRTAMKIN